MTARIRRSLYGDWLLMPLMPLPPYRWPFRLRLDASDLVSHHLRDALPRWSNRSLEKFDAPAWQGILALRPTYDRLSAADPGSGSALWCQQALGVHAVDHPEERRVNAVAEHALDVL
jgi:hypothetical protein